MVQVTVGTNTKRKKVVVDETATLRNILEENEIDYSTSNVSLDGVGLNAGDMDKSLGELGITETCYLIACQKMDNAR